MSVPVCFANPLITSTSLPALLSSLQSMIRALLGKFISSFRHVNQALAHRPVCFNTFFNIDVFPEPNGPWTKATVLGASDK